MQTLKLKANHKSVDEYYKTLEQYDQLGVQHEMAVKSAFHDLLSYCGRQFSYTLIPEYPFRRKNQRPVKLDGALVDDYKLAHGFWEAKDEQDDLVKEVKKKFDVGYPKDNIIFQSPERAIIYQDGKQLLDENISKANILVDVLKEFFDYQPPAFEQWEEAISDFKEKVSDLGEGLKELIESGRKVNKPFITAFNDFMNLCRQSINPNLSDYAIEEMLIQHLLTERLFRKVFNNPDFSKRNIIAVEIEKVIDALTSQSFSRPDFLKGLDRYYGAIETTASTIEDFSQKQGFLNSVYEKFFQGFSVKVADTHGIVYTPQPIVDFMVKSVEDILQKEFNRSLNDKGVHILDPFVGTGNFIVRIMQEMKKSSLPHKYNNELHCNEVMLLPYYIASMNIEHEYLELTGTYKAFEGICMVDTFELLEDHQPDFFTQENTERVNKQKDSSIFVIIGNPPYNASQVNENDNNKNRKYPVMDNRIKETYVKDSKATLRSQLYDPYVKAIRWASDRIGKEGMIALVTNNSFIDQIAFDGMRQHLEKDFSSVYVLDLGGNVRKNPKLSGTIHNVFGIQVGVSISFFIKKQSDTVSCQIFYARVDEFWRKEQKYHFMDETENRHHVEWQIIEPDKKHTWLTEGLQSDFDDFIPLGTKEAKSAKTLDNNVIFKTYSPGVNTGRDSIVYDFNAINLLKRIEQFCEDYNAEVFRYQQKGSPKDLQVIDNLVNYDKIQWSEALKRHLMSHHSLNHDQDKSRIASYRPFTRQYLYFDKILIDRSGLNQTIFPTPSTEHENRVICHTAPGSPKLFHCLMVKSFPDYHLTGDSRGFSFYTYNEDGSNRRENLTDWALQAYRDHYHDKSIDKWAIFHYIYGLLHHPEYRNRYQANLKRELPRIPFAKDFWAFSKAGKRLAEIHVDYEKQKEYPLERIENPDEPLNYRIGRMKLSKDNSELYYNDFLTLKGIPEDCFEYRLGNRSALDWVIDQYQVKTDKRSGITNDPNNLEDPEYILRLLGQVITVSLETVDIVKSLPDIN